MIRGTTPTHVFKLPFDTALLATVEIAYAQNDKVLLRKTKDECELTGRFIATRLSQDETMRFDHNEIVQIQLQTEMTDGTAPVSEVFWISVGQFLEGMEVGD